MIWGTEALWKRTGTEYIPRRFQLRNNATSVPSGQTPRRALPDTESPGVRTADCRPHHCPEALSSPGEHGLCDKTARRHFARSDVSDQSGRTGRPPPVWAAFPFPAVLTLSVSGVTQGVLVLLWGVWGICTHALLTQSGAPVSWNGLSFRRAACPQGALHGGLETESLPCGAAHSGGSGPEGGQWQGRGPPSATGHGRVGYRAAGPHAHGRRAQRQGTVEQ